MYLTSDEERALEGEYGETVRKSMEILVALGKIYSADRLIEVESVQISGISYRNIGDPGIEWLESLNARVRVPTLINPAGMDIHRWQDMGITEEFARKQMRILNALKKIGAKPELTCTPYYILKPSKGDHLAWSESSAVIYANSVIGARTNREGGPSAIASALTGKTPRYGMHIRENRAPDVIVDVNLKLKSHEYSLLGYMIGEEVGDRIPLFIMKGRPSEEDMKSLGAGLASTGGIPMFHVKDVTPESNEFDMPKERMVVENLENPQGCEDPDLIAIGCPHLSGRELKKISNLLNRKVKKELWIFTSRYVRNRIPEVIRKIEMSGARVYTDTCMVVSPATERFGCVMVNSGKALCYLPKLSGLRVKFGSLEECVEEAMK